MPEPVTPFAPVDPVAHELLERTIAGLCSHWSTSLVPGMAVMVGSWEPGMHIVDAAGKTRAAIPPRPKPGSVAVLRLGGGGSSGE